MKSTHSSPTLKIAHIKKEVSHHHFIHLLQPLREKHCEQFDEFLDRLYVYVDIFLSCDCHNQKKMLFSVKEKMGSSYEC